jgi:glycosyltransferase involved in cell wall biosynthesis
VTRRVLVVLHEAVDGGAGRAVRRLHDPLSRRGFELEYFDPPDRPIRYSLAALREPPGVLRRAAAVPGYLGALRRRIDGGSYDLVHANTLLTAPEAAVARAAGLPTVIHAHEMLPGGAKGRLAAAAARRGAAVVAVSQAVADRLADHGVSARVVRNGIELAPPAAPADRRPPVVATLGTICRRKGSDIFVDAVALLRREGAAAHFVLAGPPAPGPEAAWARALMQRAGAQEIACPGRVEGSALLGAVDVLVVPSREDPFPLVVLEGMAAGLAIVAAAVDGIPEQLGGGAGQLVAPDDPRALAAAIAALLASADERRRLGAVARARAGREFTLDRQADGLAAAYELALRPPA